MKVLVLSGQDNDVNIQHALTIGAVDFIAKPADPELLMTRLQHHQRLNEIDFQREQQKTVSIIGDSVAMQMVNDQIEQFANSPFPVLIEGLSGTGKELVARELHDRSSRKNEPYLAINCAAIAPDLLEAQLFGHAKGAFTGATQEHKGFFIEAGKGTLVLDEIGELPLALQGKLLRVLESGEFYRIGETKELRSDARIIAATNKIISEEVGNGNFRNDLYHRLSILNIKLPALSVRGDDVFLLLNTFIEAYADSVSPFVLDDEARELWSQYDYPGNVRELRNIVIRLGTKYPGQSITKERLSAEFETQLSATSLAESATAVSDEMIAQKIKDDEFDLDELIDEIESRSIRIALEMYGNNVSKAAKALKINRTTLYSRVQKLGSH
jgi:DNA-binding NtrC family response regulator